MIEFVALGALLGIVCGLGLAIHSICPQRAPVAPLDRLREEFAHSDMDVVEFERRLDAILTPRATHDAIGITANSVSLLRSTAKPSTYGAVRMPRWRPPADDEDWLPLTPEQEREVAAQMEER